MTVNKISDNCRDRVRPWVERQGTLLVAALVALLVVFILGAALVRGLAMRQRHLRVEQQGQQAAWFAESALQRGIVRLKATREYSGETWRSTLAIDGETLTGAAEIRIQPVPNEPTRRMIEVEAIWPDRPMERTLEQRQITITLPSSGASS